jgi:hypothetical protein
MAGERGTGAFLANLRQPMAPLPKLRLTLRNLSRRRSGRGCCGHPGEPGC